MHLRKIAEMRLDGPATGGIVTEYPLKPSKGGGMCKVAGYFIKVIARSHAGATWRPGCRDS